MINMIKQKKIPTLLGMLILVLGVGASVYLVQFQKQTVTEASVDSTPQQVRVTNVNDKSFTVSWVTGRTTTGYLAWGKSDSLGQATDADTVSVRHHITVENLSPQTTYHFKIGADKTLFTNKGKPYSVKTAPILTNIPNNDVIFGTILTPNGSPADAIIYISAPGIAPISTITNKDGKWSISLSTTRNTNLSAYSIYNKDSQLDLVIIASPNKQATAKILSGSAKPVPPIKIGETKDFTNLKVLSDGTLPVAQITVGQGQTQQQDTFNLDSFNKTVQKLVTFTAPKDRENITTTQPQFSGAGTPGQVLTIKIQTINQSITIPQSGLWKWTPAEKLNFGYTLATVTWTDSANKTRVITRNFTIIEPSPQITPSPTPAAAGSVNIASPVIPTPIPSLAPSPKPSPSPKVANVSTLSLPLAGNLTITLSIFIMGLVLVFIGLLFPNIKLYNKN